MRKMKDSGIEWIGEIPEEWSVCKIKHQFQVYSGATPKSGIDEYWDGEIIWITPADYKTEDRFVSSGKRNISDLGYSSCGTTMIPKNSIIFSKRAPIGSVAINTVDLCTNQGCLSCVKHQNVDEMYYYYFFSVYADIFDLFGSGTTFKEISFDNFANFYVIKPNKDEQQKISAFLDRKCSEIDSVIEKTKATIEEYKSLKQSVITQAVTKGIRKGRKMKDSRIEWIGEIPEEWNKCRIKHIFTTYSGATPKSEKKEYWDGDIIWITPADFKTEQVYIEKGKRTITFEGYKSCGTTLIPPNSIVFSKRAPIGTVVINTKELCTNQGCLSCVKSDMVSEKYYYYLFSIYTEIFELLGSGTTFKEISFDSFVNFVIVKPSFAEQQEIVDYLDEKCSEIDKLIAKKEQLLTELESYKKSVIFEYVTGKKEIE